MSEDMYVKVLEKKTEKIGLIKRQTNVKIAWKIKGVEEQIISASYTHFIKPIDFMVSLLDYLLPGIIELEVCGARRKVWKRPFQFSDDAYIKLFSNEEFKSTIQERLKSKE
jgi:hypothetical protein